MKQNLGNILKKTSGKPELIDLFTKAIQEVNKKDLLDEDNSIVAIKKQNETFYIRVLYLLLEYSEDYYTMEELKGWLEQEVIERG